MFLKRWKVGLIVLLTLSLSGSLFAGYRSTLNRWTKSKQWFSTKTFQANIIWKATYFSSEFRRAFTKKHIKRKFLGPLESAQYLAKQEERQSQFEEFFIDLYARKPYRELSFGKGSFWELVLVNEKGEVIQPTSIEFVGVTPYEEVMFPYLSRWSKAYRVVFPKTELGRSFRLSLRSVLGESTLKWE